MDGRWEVGQMNQEIERVCKKRGKKETSLKEFSKKKKDQLKCTYFCCSTTSATLRTVCKREKKTLKISNIRVYVSLMNVLCVRSIKIVCLFFNKN